MMAVLADTGTQSPAMDYATQTKSNGGTKMIQLRKTMTASLMLALVASLALPSVADASRKRTKNTMTGAAVGAGVGYIVGGSKGATAGAVVGAIGGYTK